MYYSHPNLLYLGPSQHDQHVCITTITTYFVNLSILTQIIIIAIALICPESTLLRVKAFGLSTKASPIKPCFECLGCPLIRLPRKLCGNNAQRIYKACW